MTTPLTWRHIAFVQWPDAGRRRHVPALRVNATEEPPTRFSFTCGAFPREGGEFMPRLHLRDDELRIYLDLLRAARYALADARHMTTQELDELGRTLDASIRDHITDLLVNGDEE